MTTTTSRSSPCESPAQRLFGGTTRTGVSTIYVEASSGSTLSAALPGSTVRVARDPQHRDEHQRRLHDHDAAVPAFSGPRPRSTRRLPCLLAGIAGILTPGRRHRAVMKHHARVRHGARTRESVCAKRSARRPRVIRRQFPRRGVGPRASRAGCSVFSSVLSARRSSRTSSRRASHSPPTRVGRRDRSWPSPSAWASVCTRPGPAPARLAPIDALRTE